PSPPAPQVRQLQLQLHRRRYRWRRRLFCACSRCDSRDHLVYDRSPSHLSGNHLIGPGHSSSSGGLQPQHFRNTTEECSKSSC
ncbi:hypothetical protein PENTCL1PPCAC_19519, partial [Pristionchus entomophagus]